MKHSATFVHGLALAIAAASFALKARAADAGQATVRDIYDRGSASAIAKSLGMPKLTDGSRFAIVQFGNGSWAIAYVPHDVQVGKTELVDLAAEERSPSEFPSRMVVVKMLTPNAADAGQMPVILTDSMH